MTLISNSIPRKKKYTYVYIYPLLFLYFYASRKNNKSLLREMREKKRTRVKIGGKYDRTIVFDWEFHQNQPKQRSVKEIRFEFGQV